MKSDKLKQLLAGIRLNTKAPKIEIPKNIYRRKVKHKKDEEAQDSGA